MAHRPRSANTGDPIIDTRTALTQKQAAFVDAIIAGAPNVPDAARQAGYAPSVAKSDAYDLLSQPHIQAYARACLDRAGLTMSRQAEILADAAENAQTMIVDKFGQEHFNRDHRTSIEAVRIAMNASGTIGPRTSDGSAAPTVNIFIDSRSVPSDIAIDVTPESSLQ